MQNHWNGAAKYGVSTILGTVPHTVMASIPCNDDPIFHCFHFLQHLLLVLLPVQQNCREQFALVSEKEQLKKFFRTNGLYHKTV